MPKITYDLTSSSNWNNLSGGEHTLQVVAKVTGYLDSAKSTSVSFTKEVVTTYEIKAGVYTFSDALENYATDQTEEIPFVFKYDNVEYKELQLDNYDPTDGSFTGIQYEALDGTGTYLQAYEDGYWVEKAYRTIIVENNQVVSEEFYTWFTANAYRSVVLSKGTYQFIEQPTALEKTINFDIVGVANSLTANDTYGNETDIESMNLDYIAEDDLFTISVNSNTNESYQYVMYDSSRGWYWYTDEIVGEEYTATDSSKLRTITLNEDQEVPQEFYEWAISQGNMIEIVAKETWLLNEAITLPSRGDIYTTNGFTSNGENFTSIGNPFRSLSYNNTIVYITSWEDEAYRTITFEEAVTDSELLAWLEANGTKQEAQKEFTLPTVEQLGSESSPLTAVGYNIVQGTINVSSNVYKSLSNLNSRTDGSLTNFGKTCGLDIPSEMTKFFFMGARLVAINSATKVGTTYVATFSLANLNDNMKENIHFIEYNYANNTATYNAVADSDVDVTNKTITCRGIKADGTTLILICYEKNIYTHGTWTLNQSLDFSTKFESYIEFKAINNPGVKYGKIEIGTSAFGGALYYYQHVDTSYERVLVVDEEGWRGSNYTTLRTIAFAEEPTGQLLTWLNNNGVKQSEE